MFSSIAKFFSSSTGGPPSADNDREDRSKYYRHFTADDPSDSKPLPPPPDALGRTGSFPSTLTLDRIRNGPSHVSWITSTNSPPASTSGSPSISPSPSRPILRTIVSDDSGRIAAIPIQPENMNGGPILRDGIWRIPSSMANAVLGTGIPKTPEGNGEASYRISGGRMSSDSGSLHLQSVYLSDTDSNSILSSLGGGASGVPSGSRPLSPIDEGPSQNQSPSDSVKKTEQNGEASDLFLTPTYPLTPASNPFATPTVTPTTPLHPAFLTRPLRRSISQTSTSTVGTFMTPTSAAAPAPAISNGVLVHQSPGPYTPVSSTGSTSLSTPTTPRATTCNTIAHGYVHPNVAPIISPVDPRPSFSGSLTPPFPHTANSRRVQLAAAPSLPTVLGSPTTQSRPLAGGQNVTYATDIPHTHVSVIYESDDSVRQRNSVATGRSRWRDSGRSMSFVTAPSMHMSDPECEDEDEDEEEDIARPSGAADKTDKGKNKDSLAWTYEDVEYPHSGDDANEYASYLARYRAAIGERDVAESVFSDSKSHMSLPEGYCDIEPAIDAAKPGIPAIVVSQAQDIVKIERTLSWASDFLHEGHTYSQDVHIGAHDLEGDTSTIATHRMSTYVDHYDRQSHDAYGSILETMSQHTASDITDSAVTMVDRAIARRWFQTRSVSWGSFRSFRDSIYLYTRRRWPLTRAQMEARRNRKEADQAIDSDAYFDFEFGIGKQGQGVDWQKRRSGGDDDGKQKSTRGLALSNWEKGTTAERSATLSTSPACLLFWLGFIAPWCWLLGGWYLSARSGLVKESEGQFVHTIDHEALWWPRRAAARRKAKTKKRRNHAFGSGWFWLWRTVKPSEYSGNGDDASPETDSRHVRTHSNDATETTMMRVVDGPTEDTNSSIQAVYSLQISQPGSVVLSNMVQVDGAQEVVDPWVLRCRVAAVVGGVVLLVVAVVVAVVIMRA